MLPVANQLRNHPGRLGRRADHPRRAMQERRHRVEEVRDVGSARRNCGLRLLIVRVRVRNRNRADFAHVLNIGNRTRQFRRDIGNLDQTIGGLVEPQEHLYIRVLQIGSVLRALLLLGEKGAFHMNPAQHGAARGRFFCKARACLIGCFELLFRQRHGSGRKGRNAVFRQIPREGFEAFIIPVRKILAGVAVVMHVDKPRHDIGAGQIDSLAFLNGKHARKASVFHRETAFVKAEIGPKHHCVLIHHRLSLRRWSNIQIVLVSIQCVVITTTLLCFRS
ncbi:hypothetical protein SDC9_162621 [bioreactor metagenome]|uniref:Uncharacterized protein n=1 Tax=bioreactor metagenome TaxID=1076179 RepID=A0A645FLL1_9ZZZZ